ncbi:unnamed protein product [Calypogeia fissa]
MAPVSIPCGSGEVVHLKRRQRLKIGNTHGNQVVNTWAFATLEDYCDEDTNYFVATRFRFRYLSMCHTLSLGKLTLAKKDILGDNTGEPMLTMIEDTSGGAHDLLSAACHKDLYEEIDMDECVGNCESNLAQQLYIALDRSGFVTERGKKGFSFDGAIHSACTVIETWSPDPLSLFMNVGVAAVKGGKGGKVSPAEPTCPIGGYVVLRAETECIVIMSACPMTLYNEDEPRGAEYEVSDA